MGKKNDKNQIVNFRSNNRDKRIGGKPVIRAYRFFYAHGRPSEICAGAHMEIKKHLTNASISDMVSYISNEPYNIPNGQKKAW